MVATAPPGCDHDEGPRRLPGAFVVVAQWLLGGSSVAAQWNESPQAQEPVAFGLSIVKPCFSMVSTKSITAPLR